jgi:pyridoxal phosphate enzyme (YggS family)
MLRESAVDEPAMTDVTASRRDQLAGRLAALRRRIDNACAESRRAGAEITLIAVAKTRPVSDVRALVELGVHDIGENRDQEAAGKASTLTGLDVRWHFVGQLQRNKVNSVASYADVVHSVDRLSLVRALARASAARERPLGCLIQVSLADGSSPTGRGGAGAKDIPALADAVAAAGGLRLGGVMAIAPRRADPDRAFGRLAAISERLRADHPHATVVSAGMSGDLEAAIRYGATHLRVGTALFGARATPVG